MSEENRTPTSQFVEVGDVDRLGESASEGEDNLRSQLLDRRLSLSEIDRRINAIAAPLATQLETLIQSVRKLRERILNRSTEKNAACERSRLSDQHSDTYCFLVEFQFILFSNIHLFVRAGKRLLQNHITIHSFIFSVVRTLNHSLAHFIMNSFIHSFIRSFNRFDFVENKFIARVWQFDTHLPIISSQNLTNNMFNS